MSGGETELNLMRNPLRNGGAKHDRRGVCGMSLWSTGSGRRRQNISVPTAGKRKGSLELVGGRRKSVGLIYEPFFLQVP